MKFFFNFFRLFFFIQIFESHAYILQHLSLRSSVNIPENLKSIQSKNSALFLATNYSQGPEPMKKEEFITAVASKSSISKQEADRILKLAIETIIEAVSDNKKVSIPGLGTFEPRPRSGREAKNVRSGETIYIKPSRVPAFSAAKGFKTAVKKKAQPLVPAVHLEEANAAVEPLLETSSDILTLTQNQLLSEKHKAQIKIKPPSFMTRPAFRQQRVSSASLTKSADVQITTKPPSFITRPVFHQHRVSSARLTKSADVQVTTKPPSFITRPAFHQHRVSSASLRKSADVQVNDTAKLPTPVQKNVEKVSKKVAVAPVLQLQAPAKVASKQKQQAQVKKVNAPAFKFRPVYQQQRVALVVWKEKKTQKEMVTSPFTLSPVYAESILLARSSEKSQEIPKKTITKTTAGAQKVGREAPKQPRSAKLDISNKPITEAADGASKFESNIPKQPQPTTDSQGMSVVKILEAGITSAMKLSFFALSKAVDLIPAEKVEVTNSSSKAKPVNFSASNNQTNVTLSEARAVEQNSSEAIVTFSLQVENKTAEEKNASAVVGYGDLFESARQSLGSLNTIFNLSTNQVTKKRKEIDDEDEQADIANEAVQNRTPIIAKLFDSAADVFQSPVGFFNMKAPFPLYDKYQETRKGAGTRMRDQQGATVSAQDEKGKTIYGYKPPAEKSKQQSSTSETINSATRIGDSSTAKTLATKPATAAFTVGAFTPRNGKGKEVTSSTALNKQKVENAESKASMIGTAWNEQKVSKGFSFVGPFFRQNISKKAQASPTSLKSSAKAATVAMPYTVSPSLKKVLPEPSVTLLEKRHKLYLNGGINAKSFADAIDQLSGLHKKQVQKDVLTSISGLKKQQLIQIIGPSNKK